MSRWQSYHLLTACADDASQGVDPFAWVVAGVVRGFVAHEDYVATTARSRLAERTADVAVRTARWASLDANPLVELLLLGPDRAVLERGWNELNRLSSLGVESRFEGERGLVRTCRSVDGDTTLRARIANASFAWLLERIGRANAGAVGPRRLLSTRRDLRGRSDGVADVVEHLYEAPTVDVRGAAKALGCSRRSLQRELTRASLSFRSLRQAVRLTTAASALRESDDSLTAIAHASGFFDSAHFCRAWRQSTGVSPSTYRRWSAPAKVTLQR